MRFYFDFGKSKTETDYYTDCFRGLHIRCIHVYLYTKAEHLVAWVGYLPAWLLALLNEARTRADRRPPSVVVRDRSRGDPTVVQQAPEAV